MFLLQKFYKEIAILLLLLLCGTLVYQKVIERGVKKGREEVVEYNAKIDEKIEVLEDFMRVVVVQNEQSAKVLHRDLGLLLTEAKKKPMYIKNGDGCTLSPEFVDSYNTIITRANSK